MVSAMENSSLFQIINLVGGMLVGPIGGVFFLGILIPWADTIVRINVLPSIKIGTYCSENIADEVFTKS